MVTGRNENVSHNEIFDGSSVQGHLLLKYAISAPSCLNTQPWLFKFQGNEIKLIVDTRRWRKNGDKDQRELYISAGCALENLLIAAEHFGYGHQIFYGEDEQAAIIRLNPCGKPSPFRGPELFKAIPQRYTNRKIYENRILPLETPRLLQNVCIEEGLKLNLACDEATKGKANDLLKQAFAIQLSNVALREELGYWLGQGLFKESWIKSKIAYMITTNTNIGKNKAKKFSELLMSATAFGIISSENNDRMSQMKAGQILERVWLKATTLGIGLHPISQFLELPKLKEEAKKLIPFMNAYPQMAIGLGYAEPIRRRMIRRPRHEFIYSARE